MPLIKSVVRIGNSRGVILPASWLEEIEQRTKGEVKQVLVEINGEIKIKAKEEVRPP